MIIYFRNLIKIFYFYFLLAYVILLIGSIDEYCYNEFETDRDKLMRTRLFEEELREKEKNLHEKIFCAIYQRRFNKQVFYFFFILYCLLQIECLL